MRKTLLVVTAATSFANGATVLGQYSGTSIQTPRPPAPGQVIVPVQGQTVAPEALYLPTPLPNAVPYAEVEIRESAPLALAMPAPTPGTRSCGPLGGASIFLLQPNFSDNTAYTRFTSAQSGPNSVAAANAGKEFAWDVQPAIASWLGYLSPSGLGVRGRFFYFNQSSSVLEDSLSAAQASAGSAISVPSFGLPAVDKGLSTFGSPGALLADAPALGQDFLSFSSDLRILSLDLEAMYQVAAGQWSFLFSGGGRYMSLSQGYSAKLRNPGEDGATENQSLQVDTEFQGGGPTVALHATWQLGRSRFALFGSLRGSLLFGESHQNAEFDLRVRDPNGVTSVGSQTTVTSASNSLRRTIPVAEMELGVECGLPVGRTRIFSRMGAVSQTYFDAGSASQSGGNLSMFGGQFSLGLNF